MQSTNYKLEKLIKIICLVISIGGIILTIALFSTNSGDALVTLVTSKSFQNGFFFFGPEGPKWSTTSPLQALLFAPFYIFITNSPIIIFKIINLVLFVGTGFLLFKISQKIVNNKIFSYLTLAIWLGNPYLFYLTAALYDSILMAFLVSLFILKLLDFNKLHLFKKLTMKDWIEIGIIAALLPLVRPEAILISLLGYLYLFVLNSRIDKKFYSRFLLSFIIFILIFCPYYIYLGIVTHQLIPSSIAARATMHLSIFNFLESIKPLFSLYWQYLIIYFLFITSFLSFVFFKKIANTSKSNLKFLLILITLFLPIFIISGQPRYLSSIIPILTLLSAFFFYQIYFYLFLKCKFFKEIVITTSILIVIILVYSYGYVYENIPRYNLDLIFEKDAADILNKITFPDDKVLAYEAQIQYFLNSSIISLDGIVGGEILPYFRKQTDLRDFLLNYRPNYIIVSDAFKYRDEYNNTVFRWLYSEDLNIIIGNSYNIDNIIFTKIAENRKNEIAGFNQWKSIYHIQYK